MLSQLAPDYARLASFCASDMHAAQDSNNLSDAAGKTHSSRLDMYSSR